MRALLSVSNKDGLVVFAKKLSASGVELISTGNTANTLQKAGLRVREVSEITGFPEIMDGRVKTLHPAIFGAILGKRKKHAKEMKHNGITPIDLVAVNLYPFEESRDKGELNEEKLIELIDIGGPSLLRAAAKNYHEVTLICDPSDYTMVAEQIESHGSTDLATRRKLACKAFERVRDYDEAIASWFREITGLPELLDLHYEKVRKLRYGENPYQKAAFFRNPLNRGSNVTNARVLHGKELSFNNIVDANSALELVKEFRRPTVAFVKHNNPCGVACAATLERALDLSFCVDSLSAFGSVVAMNRTCTAACAEFMRKKKIFIELIICPKFEPRALALLKQSKNIRLLETGVLLVDPEKRDIKKVAGGILVQTANTKIVTARECRVVTKKKPTALQLRAMLFANQVCKHVMSNAIVFANSANGDDVVTGVGAGQMSRVDAVKIAAMKAGKLGSGAVMASDAFFPFCDAVEQAAKAGIRAIISPGGSVRDADVIACADRLGLAMVFTGVRFFRH